MKVIVKFCVPATPVAQPRPRAYVRGRHASVYEAESNHPIHAFKQAVKLAARLVHRDYPLDGPVSVHLIFVMPRPKSAPKKKGRLWHVSRPDADNLAKGLLDACKDILWTDDSQVAHLEIIKKVGSLMDRPAVYVTVTQLEDE